MVHVVFVLIVLSCKSSLASFLFQFVKVCLQLQHTLPVLRLKGLPGQCIWPCTDWPLLCPSVWQRHDILWEISSYLRVSQVLDTCCQTMHTHPDQCRFLVREAS